GNSQGPLLASGFGYPDPAHRFGPVGFLPQFLGQFFQPTVHALSLNLLEADSIHSRCAAVFAAAPPSMQHHTLAIQLVVEGVKPAGRFSLRFGMQCFLKLPDTLWSY